MPAIHSSNLDPFSSSAIVRTKASALVRKFVPLGSHLLDIGAHSGAFAAHMVTLGYRVTALDDAPHGDFQPFLRADANAPWPVDPDSLDAVTAWHVVEHLENPHHFFREAHRVLKRGGYTFVSLPNPFHWRNRLSFLTTGDFSRYRHNEFHITPFIRSSFMRAYAPLFSLCSEGYAELHKKRIPRPLFPFLKKSNLFRMLFGESYFAVLQKVN